MQVGTPLDPPEDARLLESYRAHAGLRPAGGAVEDLVRVASAFSRLPYENLTKIIKEAGLGRRAATRRGPGEVIADHARLGTGGTCFSLTATLLHLVRALGFEARPVLADRRYGPDTHCALVVWIGRAPHLLDPGYLIVEPIPLEGREERRVCTAFNTLVLTPRDGGARVDLSTEASGRLNRRLTFKTAPVDAGEFLRAWDASFDWDGMRYPVLSRVDAGRQLYLQGNRFQVRRHRGVERDEIAPGDMIDRIARAFGIAPEVAARALRVLRERGEARGPA